MADPEVKINITSEYDGAAAERALLDIENLPLEAQGLAEVFNQNFAAVEQMEEGLRRATEEMREHIASLDPAADGYEKAVAAAQSYISQQVTLSQQCEKVRGDIVEQANVINDLARSLARGRISERAFNDELEGISQEGIKAEQTIERLGARIDRMNARRNAATNLDPAAKAAAAQAAAAEKAAAAQAAAAEKAAAAAAQEQQKAEALRREMGLETKSRAELRAEIERLTAAMKEAAAAGNGEQYTELKERLEEARGAMSRLNAEAKLTKDSGGVPPEAMRSWSGFFNYIKKGAATCTISFKNIATAAGGLARIGAWGTVAKVAFDGLGKSFRVFSDQLGMGIEESTTLSNVFEGFLETASEGVASIVGGITGYLTGAGEAKAATDSWAGSIGEVINNLARVVNYKAELAAIAKQEAEYNKKLAAEQERARQDILDAAQEGFAKELDAKIDAAKAASEELKESTQSEYEAATRQLEARKAAADREFEIDKQRIELEKERGNISKATAAVRTAELEGEHARELAAIDQAAAALKEKYAAALADAAQEFKEELGKVLTEGDLAKWAPVLEVQLPDVERLRVLTDQLELTKKDIGETYSAEEQANQQRLIEERVEILNQVRELAKTINGIDASLGVTEENAVSFAEGLQESAEKFQEIKERAEEEVEKREEALEAAEEGVEAAKDEAAASKEKARINLRITRQQQTNAREKEAGARAEKAAQEEVKRLSKERADELKSITEQYKTSGRYAEQDNRTEAEKLAADEEILQERLKELSELQRRSSDADAATQARISEALKQTQREIRGYNQAVSAGRVAASQSLQQWKTSGPGPTNNVYKGNVKRLQRAMDRMAQQYERAAAKGDTKAMENINRRGNACAQNLEKLTGYTGKYADQWNQIQAEGTKLQKAYRGLTVQEEKELATLQKNEQETARREELEAKINRWKEQHATAEQQAADAAEEGMRLEEEDVQAEDRAADAARRGEQLDEEINRGKEENADAADRSAAAAKRGEQLDEEINRGKERHADAETRSAAAAERGVKLEEKINQWQEQHAAAEQRAARAAEQAARAAERQARLARTPAAGRQQGMQMQMQGQQMQQQQQQMQQQQQQILQQNQQLTQMIEQQAELATTIAQQSLASLQSANEAITQIVGSMSSIGESITQLTNNVTSLASVVGSVASTAQAGIAANRAAISALEAKVAALAASVARLASQI